MKTRREFIKKTTALTALGLMTNWASTASVNDKLGKVLPKRQLIRDGEKVTVFCLG